MKKVFLTLTMLLFAFAGTMKAGVDVEVGTGTSSNSYLPDYTYYDYAVSQQIYTASEIGMGGTISAISFDVASGSATRSLKVYMKHVSRSTFSSTSDWEAFNESDALFSGNVTWAAGWVTITLDTPFDYNGTDNLLVCVQDVSGTWVSSQSFRVYSGTTNNSMYKYRDGTPFDLNSMPTGSRLATKNHIKLNIELGPAAITMNPDPLTFGRRPNGAWMRPAVVTLENTGNDATVTNVETNNTFFTVNAEVPFEVIYGEPTEIEVGTGEGSLGPVTGQLMVAYSDRTFTTIDLSAEVYDPVAGDVWENAVVAGAMPYTTTAPLGIEKNYELPTATTDADAVYKVTFDSDKLFSASASGTNPVAYIYNEGFEGVGGPDEYNYYDYYGPTINPGPINMWFYYDFTGNYSNLGYSTAGYLYYGYMIPAATLQELGLGNCAITTVESAINNYDGTYCDLFILKGGDTPDINNLVYYQEFTDFTYGYYFDITLDEPLFLGDDENIWIMFSTDNTRLYAGVSPIDPAGQVWYSRDASTWYNNAGYTPVIYTQFLELPTGRQIAVGSNDFKMREAGASSAGDLTAVDGEAMGVSIAQNHINAHNKAHNSLRSTDIQDLYVSAGTYYVVMASDESEFAVNMSVTDIPKPEQAFIYSPYDGQTNVSYPYLAEWMLGNYTSEMQVLFGTQYPPTSVLIDWTDELVESAFLPELENNKNYFMQVNARNAAGTTMGEVIGFSTPIDPVEGFTVAEENLYPGDAAEFSWEANGRTLMGYNLYKDGVLVNTEGPITGTEYTVEDLEYNMGGYQFAVASVYGSGISELSEPVTVYMTGTTTISGTVYDQDSVTVIPNAEIEFRGTDEYGNDQVITATADENGAYTCEVLAGYFTPYVVSAAYDPETPAAAQVTVVYNDPQTVNLYTHEFYFPLGMITATLQEEEDNVLVEWDWTPASLIVDFETGDFSQAEFTLPATYPWIITTTNPYEGTYCMKSSCEGVASATSSIEATVEVPFDDAKMSFYVRVSSESNYDKFHFYIDGVEQGAALSGNNPYALKEYSVTAGTHTYKWEYTKDSSVNSNDDCIYVDNITMYRQDVPLPPVQGATSYNFDDQTMMGWTSVDGDGDGNGWVSSANPGIYHNSGVSLSGTGHDASEAYVISGSYANQTGQALTPNNYLVSPTQISAENGAQIQFYACAQDASYAAEHFGVAVSTTTATASAFTTIQEWTMTAKGPQGSTAENVRDVRGTRQGAWYLYTADLSAYAGQDIWVAIRHFNCTDMFILNVDDIVLADGSAKPMARDNRTFQGFNLYRRDIKNGEDVATADLIATPAADVLSYIDNDWTTLDYGMWQWGIQATYEGNAPTDGNRDEATYTFEGGLDGWTVLTINTEGGEWLHSDNNPGGYDYTALAHGGTGFAMCYSFVDYVGSYNTDSYLVSPQKYNIGASSTLTFWADNANDSYPEEFSVCISTAATPSSASDFTEVWNGGAKGNAVSDKAEVRHQNNRYENWRSHSIDLSAYAGQEVWIAFHDVNYDMYEIWIDDVTVNYEGGTTPTPTPTPTPAGSGVSDILWSNVIEKDMYADVTVNVALNNNQAPTGAALSIVGPETYTATVDETGVVEFANFRKGEYEITATLEGYVDYIETVLVEEEMTINVVLTEIIAPVENLYVSPTGWAMWAGGTAGGTTPVGPVGPGGVIFEDDFEDGALANWTTIDADGDGDTWQNATPAAYGIGDAHSGTNCASSWSWNSYSMDPDNYMVSPLVEGATNIQFYVATNLAYPDHYGVFASSTGTNASDFSMVFEESAGAKGIAGVKSSMTQGSSREMSAWNAKSVDLPAGTKYVAFRHWNSYDMNYLFIDDVTINGGRGDRVALSYKVKIDGVFEGETPNPYFQHNVEGFEEGSEHTTSVAALYATGLGDWVDYTWTYVPCENYDGVTNYAAAVDGNNVTLTWTLNATPGPGPGPTPPPTGGWTEDFENGALPTGWAIIDADGDGYNWTMASVGMGTGYGHNGSSDMILSQSYVNGVGALNPNNYLVTSQVTPVAGSTFSFYACAQDATYAAEHFGVAVSTGSQTNASDFTMVQEWTMTAKGSGVMVPGRDGVLRAQGNWYEYTVDLSAYAGQNIYIAIRHFNCSDWFYLDVDDVAFTTSTKGNRNMWDIVYEFDASSGYQYGVATDGQNIYTSSWSASSTSMFYKYDMQGNFIEEFNISGCGQLRGMAYDGEYFYGVANSSTVYCVDLANHALVGSFTTSYGAMRCITYDPERDGFWVVGNWSGNLTLIDRTGAIVQAGPAPTSASDVAYYKDPDGVEHIYYLKNESGNGELYEYNITTGVMGSSPLINCASNSNWTGSSGGCFVGTYDNKTCFFADAQQTPQHIVIYELDASGTPGPGPVIPTPGDVLGVYVFRDGELISGQTALTTNTYTDSNVEAGEHEYCVRVVYSDYAMSCPECETVEIGESSCDPVTNLTAELYTYNGNDGALVSFTQPAGATSFKIYVNGELLGSLTAQPVFINFMGSGDDTYEIGVVAVYADCESDMATVPFIWNAIGENDIVNNIYPNPTNDKVTIEAQGMNHITVANALGQVVYDADVDADQIELNLGQYNTGIYLVRISTVNGVSVKRVSVVK